ncbi:MAG: hypothetical protein LBJ00_17930 [Planctomycetaceae bacterium]|jgi:hypothetical protein|nr:hypothetical protein [Planctomycetaceae bacterium]
MQDNFHNNNVEFVTENASENNQRHSESTRRSGFSCLKGCGIGCLVLLIITAIIIWLIYVYCIKGVQMRISPETTLVTSPLKSDGKSIDFFMLIKDEVDSQDLTKNNGFKDVLAAYGKELVAASRQDELGHGWIFTEMCKSVDLDPQFTPAHVYKEPEFNIILDKEKSNGNGEDDIIPDNKYESNELIIYQKVLSKDWSIKEHPKLAEWLESVGSGLDVVQKAALEEVYFIPLVRRNENDLAIVSIAPHVVSANRNLIHGLQVRSMLRIGEGEYTKAWDDLLASFHLRRKLINRGIQLFGDEPDQIKLQVIKTVVESSAKWESEQLDNAIANLKTIPQYPKREDLLLITQYLLLDIFSMAGDSKQFVESISGQSVDSHAASKQMMKSMISLMDLCGFDWNIVAKHLNEAIEAHKKSIGETGTEKILNAPSKDIKHGLDEFTGRLSVQIQNKIIEMFTVSGRSEFVGFVIGEFVPVLERHVFKQTLNDEIRHRLLLTALTISKYERENKKYPESLDQLKLEPPRIPAMKTNYEITDKGYKISIGDMELEIYRSW